MTQYTNRPQEGVVLVHPFNLRTQTVPVPSVSFEDAHHYARYIRKMQGPARVNSVVRVKRWRDS